MDTISLLMITAVVLVTIIVILLFVLFKMSNDEKASKPVKKGKQESINIGKEEVSKTGKQSYNKQSIFDFMEFDRIEDNMIVQKDDKRYLMVVECQGINYDLMSGVEKTAVEEGFAQFLNALRYPIQIYTQTRTINLENSLQTYTKRLDDIRIELEKKESKYKHMQNSGHYTEEELEKQNLEILREKNLYEYGKDIIYYTEKMSLNKSVLRKQYYIIIPYYSAEAGNEFLDKEEVKNIAFSELYTKAQSLARVLAGCSITSKVMDSYDLVDFLYAAYNRDEAETYGFDRALRAGYDELYVTAPDILEKRMEELDKEIEKKAYELAKQMINDARSEQRRKVENKESDLESFINKMTISIIEENSQYIGKEVAEKAKDKVESGSKKTKEEGGDTDVSTKEIKATRKYTKHK